MGDIADYYLDSGPDDWLWSGAFKRRRANVIKVRVKNVRLAFLAAHEPKAFQADGALKYQAQLIINPKSENVKILDDALIAAATEKWDVKAKQIFAELVKKDRVCFKHGPKTNASGDVYQGFEGMYSCSSSNVARPLLIDADKTPLVAADGKPYAGCYADVVLEIWAQDNQYGKRINATLKGIQFFKDGDAFAGGVPATTDDFDDLSVGAEEVENFD